MKKSDLIDNLKTIGVRITREGVIKDLAGEPWGIIFEDVIQKVDGDIISFKDAESVDNPMNQTGYFEINHKNGFIIAKCDLSKTIKPNEENKERMEIAATDTGETFRAMPKTDSELTEAFPVLYPDWKDKIFYDEMNESEMINLSMFGGEDKTVEITDSIENQYLVDIEEKLKLNGFGDPEKRFNPPNVEVRLRILSNHAQKNRRNLFREWVEATKWDGKSRIATWFKDKFNAGAPALRESGWEDTYLRKVAEAWFLGGIQRMFKATQHDVVPVLIGPQGCGKSSGLEYTAGNGEWFAATTINISNPNGLNLFLDSVRGKSVVELAEATTIRSSDQEAMKAFISRKEDRIRKPYARRQESYPRHFIMAATTNIKDVFTDITGNRRFYPISCEEMTTIEMLEKRDPEDVKQVWAEALELYRNHYDAAIPPNWEPAVLMQKHYTQENLNSRIIDDWLNDPINQCDKIGVKVTSKTILENCFNTQTGRPIPEDVKKCLKSWRNTPSKEWQYKSSMKIDGRVTSGWVRIAEHKDYEIEQKPTAEEQAAMDEKFFDEQIERLGLTDKTEENASEMPLNEKKEENHTEIP